MMLRGAKKNEGYPVSATDGVISHLKDFYLDGGQSSDIARRCIEAGADVIAAGSTIFGVADPEAAIRELRGGAVAA